MRPPPAAAAPPQKDVATGIAPARFAAARLRRGGYPSSVACLTSQRPNGAAASVSRKERPRYASPTRGSHSAARDAAVPPPHGSAAPGAQAVSPARQSAAQWHSGQYIQRGAPLHASHACGRRSAVETPAPRHRPPSHRGPHAVTPLRPASGPAAQRLVSGEGPSAMPEPCLTRAAPASRGLTPSPALQSKEPSEILEICGARAWLSGVCSSTVAGSRPTVRGCRIW